MLLISLDASPNHMSHQPFAIRFQSTCKTLLQGHWIPARLLKAQSRIGQDEVEVIVPGLKAPSSTTRLSGPVACVGSKKRTAAGSNATSPSSFTYP